MGLDRPPQRHECPFGHCRAHHAGVSPEEAAAALSSFKNVKRRLEVLACIDGITLYDDFAHHPTAIATTLQGLRARVNSARIIAVLEPRSNTMRMGVHADTIADSLKAADKSIIFQPDDLGWDAEQAIKGAESVTVCRSLDSIVELLAKDARPGDHLVFMSNGSFGGIHKKVEDALRRG